MKELRIGGFYWVNFGTARQPDWEPAEWCGPGLVSSWRLLGTDDTARDDMFPDERIGPEIIPPSAPSR